MEFKGKPIKMFELDCPFDSFEDRRVRELLGAIFALRKKGYLSRHNYGILPVDAYDFIGTHYGVYIEGDEGIEVLGSHRVTEHARCEEFKLAFPMEMILKNSNATLHLETLHRYIEQSRTQQVPLMYTSSWTISPDLRDHPEAFKAAYDLFFTANVFSYLDQPNQIKLACGSIRLKTVRPIQWLGYEYFQNEHGTELSNFQQSNLNNEDVMAMFLKEHTAESIELAKHYEFTFRKRMKVERPAHENRVDISKLKKTG